MSETAIEDLYRTLLRCWNEKNAAAYGALFTDDGMITAISDHLESIFADHDPASYAAIVEDVPLPAERRDDRCRCGDMMGT